MTIHGLGAMSFRCKQRAVLSYIPSNQIRTTRSMDRRIREMERLSPSTTIVRKRRTRSFEWPAYACHSAQTRHRLADADFTRGPKAYLGAGDEVRTRDP